MSAYLVPVGDLVLGNVELDDVGADLSELVVSIAATVDRHVAHHEARRRMTLPHI